MTGPKQEPSSRRMLAVVTGLAFIGVGWPLLGVTRENIPEDWPLIVQALTYGLVFGVIFWVCLFAAGRFLNFLAPTDRS